MYQRVIENIKENIKFAEHNIGMIQHNMPPKIPTDALSSYVPFPEIGAEVYKSWGSLLGSGPQKFNKTRIAFEAGDEGKPWDAEMGFFFKDPVTGKRMFTYPDPFNVIQKNFFGWF